MFPIQQGNNNELLFQISYTPSKQYATQQDMIWPDRAAALEAGSHGSSCHNKGKGPARKLFDRDSSDHDKDGKKMKQIMHRDIERQRRQDMATLYTSLRSLLPLEYIKGKRAVSDHMNEAVNYIKHLQKRIKELGEKRNELKSLADCSSKNLSGNFVRVCPCWGGVEILVSSRGENEGVPLSRLLDTLLQEELISVVSSTSTNVNGRLLHTIQCEVSDTGGIDLHGLQRQLSGQVFPHRDKALPSDTALRNNPTIRPFDGKQ